MGTESALWCEITDGPNRETLFDALRLGKETELVVHLSLSGNIPTPGPGLFTRHDYYRIKSISLIEDSPDDYEVRFDFDGVGITHPPLVEFVAVYNVRTRKGKVMSHKFSQQGEMAVDEAARGAALMCVVEMMVQRTNEEKTTFDNLYALKNEIDRLYEKAKLIHWATTDRKLSAAIEEL